MSHVCLAIHSIRGIAVKVKTGETEANTSSVERLLGAFVHQDMKWGEMIVSNDKSLIKSLQARINALSTIRQIVGFQSRNMIVS